MSAPAAPAVSTMDDRSSYAVAAAVIQTIARLSPEFPDEDAAWEAFIAWKGPELREYIEVIRRTRHSSFFYQLQEMYDYFIVNGFSDPLTVQTFQGLIRNSESHPDTHDSNHNGKIDTPSEVSYWNMRFLSAFGYPLCSIH